MRSVTGIWFRQKDKRRRFVRVDLQSLRPVVQLDAQGDLPGRESKSNDIDIRHLSQPERNGRLLFDFLITPDDALAGASNQVARLDLAPNFIKKLLTALLEMRADKQAGKVRRPAQFPPVGSKLLF